MKLKAVFSFYMLFLLVSCNGFVLRQSESSTKSDKESNSPQDNTSENITNGYEETGKLTILSINDLHGKIEQENGLQGISNLSAEIKRIRNLTDEDDVLLVANGDIFQGQAISNLNHGLSVINAMNEMDFDMMGIGNHEFDWGIEEITRFFDGNEENGEANFPLVNSNVYYRGTNTLLENTIPYHIVNKNNLKIGFISGIGIDQYSSILKTKSEDYVFNDIVTSLGNTAEILREQEKCDIVIANIHDGGTTSFYTYNNNALANLTGSKHIDALINGHTHYGYSGVINRSEGAPLPVVEAYSSCSALGYIELSLSNKKVIDAKASLVDMRYKKEFDQEIQDVVDNDYYLLKDQIEEVYGIAGETITYTEDLRLWSSSCMQKALDADISFSNNGGLRNVSIYKDQEILLKDVYEINPFDNEILLTNISGQTINNFINRYSSYNYYSIKDGVTILNDKNVYYKVAVIDYLGFKDYFPLGNEYENTNIVFRDIMILDIKKRTEIGEKFLPKSNPNSILDSII